MKAKNNEQYNEHTWDADMQEAWDQWTKEPEENKWDEYAKLSSQEAAAAIAKIDRTKAAKSSRVKKGQQETEPEEEEKSEKKRKDKKRKEVPQEEESREKAPKKKSNLQKASPALPASPEDRPPFPYTTKEQVPLMVDFIKKMEKMNIENPTNLNQKQKDSIRCQIPNSAEARLSVYWKRPAVGVHMRAESRDIACFSFVDASNYHFLPRLAVALKAGSLMVTCRPTPPNFFLNLTATFFRNCQYILHFTKTCFRYLGCLHGRSGPYGAS